jgi:hypothetical protein
MKKKAIYIILAVLAMLLIVFLGLRYFEKGSNTLSVTAGKEKIKINDIYKDPVKIFSNSDIEFKETADYSFNYYADDQLFIITLTDKDVVTARAKAEKNFLSALNINQEQACKLNLQLTVPFSVSEDLAGINFGLSFCPNGKQF